MFFLYQRIGLSDCCEMLKVVLVFFEALRVFSLVREVLGQLLQDHSGYLMRIKPVDGLLDKNG